MRSTLAVLFFVTACGKGQPPVADGIIGGSVDKVTFSLDAQRQAHLELVVLDKTGAMIPRFAHNVDAAVELTDGPEGDSRCRGTAYAAGTGPDPTTHRTRFDMPLNTPSVGDCVHDLLDHFPANGLFLNVTVTDPAGGRITYRQQLDRSIVHEDRAASLPALDAERARVFKLVRSIDLHASLPACTAALVTASRPLETVDLAELGGAPTWGWLTTNLFSRLERYGTHNTDPPDQLLTDLRATPVVLVYAAEEHTLPRLDGKRFDPGVFRGRGIVLDLATGAERCAIGLTATSSERIKTTLQYQNGQQISNDAFSEMTKDFKDHFADALAKAMADAGLADVLPTVPRRAP